MFGHDNQHHQDNDESNQPAPDATLAHDSQQHTSMDDDAMGGYIDDAVDTPAPATVQPDDTGVSLPDPAAATAPAIDDVPAPAADTAPNNDSLLQIKQDALQQLTPLVGHLEQSPEEKFRTTMMMIQASDNHGLIQAAYDAAKQITDEKTRAQALLDIVNEINYFTQNNPASDV